MKLVCSKRDGKKIKKLRREGLVPGVIYGKNLDENLNIGLNMKDLVTNRKHIAVGSQVELEVDGESYATMIKDFTVTPMKNDYMHFDFQVLTTGEKIKTSVAINFINKENIKEEGNVQEYLHAIEYEVLPKDMLESIDVDLSVLSIGHDITVADLDISKDEKFHVLTADNSTVVSLAPIQEVVLETEDTAQVAPEEEEAEE